MIIEYLETRNWQKNALFFKHPVSLEYVEQLDALEKSDLKVCKVIAMGEFTFRVEVENLHVGDQKLSAGDSVKLSCDNMIYEPNVACRQYTLTYRKGYSKPKVHGLVEGG